MQGYHLYEYAVIRVMPRVEREEFINIGVVLYCSAEKFLACRFELNEPRILALDPQLEMEQLNAYIQSFDLICQGLKSAGSIGQLSPAERFRWLTATRSTILQTSKVHPGFCQNPSETLERLFGELVCLK